jgi:hypothetical protein
VNLTGAYGPEKWENVIHFAWTGSAPSNGTCATFATDTGSAWATNMAPECPSPITLSNVTFTDLTSPSAGEGSDITVHAGSRGDDTVGANSAMLIRYPSATRYKGGHPRTYLAVLGNADDVDAGHWSAAATNEVQTHWQAFLTAVAALSVAGTGITSFGFVRYHGKFLPNSGAPHYYLDTPIYTPIPVGEATAESQMASQRGRIGRRKK